MIKKETTKRTREYLEDVRRRILLRQSLSRRNKGWRMSLSELAYCHSVSSGRMKAATDLGFFEVVGKNSHRNLYKCKVNYFTLEMANQVIRHEYNMGERRDKPTARIWATKERNPDPGSYYWKETCQAEPRKNLVISMGEAIKNVEKGTLSVMLAWFRSNKYKGVIYKDKEIIEL
jgi:hypothetical protein